MENRAVGGGSDIYDIHPKLFDYVRQLSKFTHSDRPNDDASAIIAKIQTDAVATMPRSFFKMSKGGIRIQSPLHKWSSTAFTFGCWIAPTLDCREVLFCFAGAYGSFICATIDSQGRIYVSSAASQLDDVQHVNSLEPALNAKEWQFLCIRMVRGRSAPLVSKKQQVEITVNQLPVPLIQDTDFCYPKITAILEGGIGCLCESMHHRLPEASHFSGYLGAIYLFNDRISACSSLASIYQAGVDYCVPVMSDSVAENIFTKFSSSFSGRLVDNVAVSFVFAFHPQATEDAVCIDVSPSDSYTGSVKASLFLNASASVNTRLCDVFIPRFRLFLPCLKFIGAFQDHGVDIHSSIIRTIHVALSQSLFPTQFATSDCCTFFSIAGSLLLHCSPENISLSSAQAYHQLVLHLWKKPDNIKPLLPSVCNHILRLDWWARPGVDSATVLHMGEICRTILLGRCPGTVINTDTSLFDRISAFIPGNDRVSMRVRHLLLSSLADLTELQYIETISFIDECRDPLHSAQFIEFLTSHLSDCNEPDVLRSSLDASLASVLRFNGSHEVLIACLHCINVLLASSRIELSSSLFTGILLPKFSEVLSKNGNPLLDDVLHRSFLELFLRNSPPGTLGVANVIGWVSSNNTDDNVFALPDIIEAVHDRHLVHITTLFGLLPAFPNIPLLLTSIYHILQTSDNRNRLLFEPLSSWAIPLFQLIEWDAMEDEFLSKGVNQLVFEVIQLILVHALIYRANASPIIRETLACLRMSFLDIPFDVFNVERYLFARVISGLQQSSFERVKGSAHQLFSVNICAFGDLLEEETWCGCGAYAPRVRRKSTLFANEPESFKEISAFSGSSKAEASVSPENWILCDEVDRPREQRSPSPSDIAADMPHVQVLIEITIQLRLSLYVIGDTGDPHRLNLLQVFLLYLSESIAMKFDERDEPGLDRLVSQVQSLVNLAALDSSGLPGTNTAVILFLQRICSLQIASQSEMLLDCQLSRGLRIVSELCSNVIASFSPFIAIQAEHYDDPSITSLLKTALRNRRFGELQTLYIHDSPDSAATMVFPPYTSTIFCIPVGIDPDTHTFSVHPHTANLLSSCQVDVDFIQTSMLQAMFSSLNEMIKFEKSSQTSRFTDCIRERCRLEAGVRSYFLICPPAISEDDVVAKRSHRIRLNAEIKARRKVTWGLNQRYDEMVSAYRLKELLYSFGCSGIVWGSDSPSQVFWAIPISSSGCSSCPVLEPFFNGSPHLDSTHTFLIQNHLNRLSFTETAATESDTTLPLSDGLTVGSNPSKEVDWDLCDIYDDDHSPDAEVSPRHAGITIDCVMVNPLTNVRGTLRVDQNFIVFEPFLADVDTVVGHRSYSCATLDFARSCAMHRHQWAFESLRSVRRRRYQLQQSALEFFFDQQECVFFDCLTSVDQARVVQEVSMLKPPNLDVTYMGFPRNVLRKSNVTRQWQRREISNFEYLSALNIISGRTFQDINQYPVFPWIISNYTSDSIDLSDSSNYRDLSKPIGAQTEAQCSLISERYEHFIGSSIAPFHFGSHYSNAGVVIFFLLRLEPFTSLHIELQDGRFDFPDRLFSSIEQTYRVCTTNRSSVKELIPEFFTLPEMFVNCNSFDLGVRQNGTPIGNVQLPPWAQGDPNRFIRIQREALESEFVSANLHNWIDLIWGYKQRGAAAVDALNVFYHLSYEGAVDLDSVLDPLQRAAMRSQISQWGQIPVQLFNKPHQPRDPLVPYPRTLKPTLSTSFIKMMRLAEETDNFLSASVCNLTVPNSKILMVTSYDHTTNALTVNASNNRVTLHPIAVTSSGAESELPTHPNSQPLPDCIIWSSSGRCVVTGNHWDCSIRLYRFSLLASTALSSNPFLKLGSYLLVQSIAAHTGRVKCLAASRCQSILVSGSDDCTLLVWNISLDDSSGRQPRLVELPQQVLIGHESSIISASIDLDMNICVSCSEESGCLVHRLNSGLLMRHLSLSCTARTIPLSISLSPLGLIIVGCHLSTADDNYAAAKLFSFSANGTLLSTIETTGDPFGTVMSISHNGRYLAFGNNGEICVYSADKLLLIQQCVTTAPCSFTSISFCADDQLIIGGTHDGRIFVFPVEVVQDGSPATYRDQ